MNKTFGTGLAVAGFAALGTLAGYLFGNKHGLAEGEKNGKSIGMKEGAEKREQEIFQDYVFYVPICELEEFGEYMMKDQDCTEHFPLLVIRPEKYNYTESVEPKKREE